MLARRLLCQAVVVAEEKVFAIVVEVHTVTLAVLPHRTVGTLAPLRPVAVAESHKDTTPNYSAMRFRISR